jgi:hypothetical protein
MDYCCINILYYKKYERSKELSAYEDVPVLQNLLHALRKFNHNRIFTFNLWEHFSHTAYVSLQLNAEFSRCVMMSFFKTARNRIRWTGHVAHVREKRNVHRVLVGKPE